MLFRSEALKKSKKTVLLPEPKYHYLQHPGSACYSTLTEENSTSVRKMLKKSEEDFGHDENLKAFIFAESMRNNAHLTSRIVLSKASGFDELLGEIRCEIKRNFVRLWRCQEISTKEKLKLTLLAYTFGIYKHLLTTIQ